MARTPDTAGSPSAVIARLDRLSVWSLPYLFIGVIGVGFLFTFYDIFDINVSFIQTCTQIIPHCTPPAAGSYLGLPVLLNLVGYAVGTVILSPLADRVGRRQMLLVTMALTGVGSLLTAFVGNYALFDAARLVTGLGIGADLAIVNTYIGEVAPTGQRARYTSFIFIMSALGAVAGIWIGLWLTTPATPFPLGLPFAVAGPSLTNGWRIMYVIGGALAAVGLLLRYQLPESPRWLVSQNRVAEADAIVSVMERRAARHGPLAAPVEDTAPNIEPERIPYLAIFRNPIYVRRSAIMLTVWLIGYVTVYSYAAGFTSLLVQLHYAPPEAGLIAAFGTFGFVACAVMAFFVGERLERKAWLPVAALITLVGGVVIAISGTILALTMIGACILFFGFNIWIPTTYSWSAENFPTQARTTGFGLVDGVGHIGGGIGVQWVAPFAAGLTVLPAFLLISGFLVVAAAVAQMGTNTRGRRLDEVSP